MTVQLAQTSVPVVAGVRVLPTTPVLSRRQVRSHGVANASRFGDQVWDLSPAIADVHSASQGIHWSAYPPRFRAAVKLYVFALVNVVEDPPRLASARSDFPAIKTIWSDMPFLRVLLRWLEARDVGSLAEVTEQDLDNYLWFVQDSVEKSPAWKRRALLAVQRLHAYRDHLPTDCRLPPRRPWGGAKAAELAKDPGPQEAANKTPRIHPDVMEPLLSAALLTIGTIAADLMPVAKRLLALRAMAQEVAPDIRRQSTRSAARKTASRDQLTALLPVLRQRGFPLPMRDDGTRQAVDVTGLSVGGWVERSTLIQRASMDQILAAGLAPAADHLRVTRFTSVSGRPWRTAPVDAGELVTLLRHVLTASFLVVGYLSGVRTGEALNLARGCIRRDSDLDLILMSGLQMKAGDGGRARSHATIPWVVVDQVAEAIAVAEELTTGSLLYPSGEFCSAQWMQGNGRARTPGSINADISRFTHWFNEVIAPAVAHPTVPPDEHGRVTAPRLRRTLAWHIVRRPGGIVAGATQYGHVRTQVTQGYSGLADAGFVDELAFEDLLVRIETLHADAERLREGEHVSGPAAAGYVERVGRASEFAGVTVRTAAQERQLVANPALNIHHGDLFTCVFRPESAACVNPDDSRPALGQCRAGCSNIAVTDRDAQQLAAEVQDINGTITSIALPAPLRARLTERRDVLERRLRSHDETRT